MAANLNVNIHPFIYCLLNEVLNEVGLKPLRIKWDICVEKTTKQLLYLTTIVDFYFCQLAVTDISHYLKYQSRQHIFLWCRPVFTRTCTTNPQKVEGMCVLEENTSPAILWAQVSVAYVNVGGEIRWAVIACGETLRKISLYYAPYLRFAYFCVRVHACFHIPCKLITSLHLHSSGKTPPSISPQHPHSW